MNFMVKVDLQKKLAAKILKVGESRVWLDPEHLKDIKNAITRADIRRLILKGWIKALPEKVKMKKERRKKRNVGKRKGKKHSIVPKKRVWINRVRPQRRLIKELKEQKKISSADYRKLYRLVKSGMFRSRAHLLLYAKQRGMIKE